MGRNVAYFGTHTFAFLNEEWDWVAQWFVV